MTVTLSWLSAASETLATGGDAVDMSWDTIAFDGSASEQYGYEATATEHPVEEGAAVTDHVRPGLRTLTLDVLVSAHPADDTVEEASATARATVARLLAEGVEVSVDTAIGSWDSMLLLRVEEQRDAERGDGYRATIMLRELRRVATLEVEAPAPRVERARRRTDRGDQEGESAEPAAPAPPTPTARESAMMSLRAWAAGVH